ncbi:MAG: DUF3703 domain-containing protein [Bacteroidota bacterium]
MKIHTTMPDKLAPHFERELTEAKDAFKSRHFQVSWRHLERAHILGQPYPLAHTYVHLKMLDFGVRTKNFAEVLGQIPRLIFGGVKSFVGEIPVGNTGGANVPPLKPMQIPDDLQQIIQQAKSK